MKNLYIRNRQERNNTGVKVNGTGDDYYNERENIFHKLSEIGLPLVIMMFMLASLAMLTYLCANELKYVMNGTPVEVNYASANKQNKYVSWAAPDGNTYTYDCNWAKVSDNKVTLYYIGTDYRGAIVVSSAVTWIMFYAFFLGVTALLILWIYRILHKSRHAVYTH